MSKNNIYILLFFFIVMFGFAAQTALKLSDIIPGTERVVPVANGAFERGLESWSIVSGNMVVDVETGGVQFPYACNEKTLQARVHNAAQNGQVRTAITLDRGKQYVLSAYLWNLSDTNHRINVVVVDLNDVYWEKQLTLYYNTVNANQGYFCYDTFTTPAGTGTISVTVRAFYENLTQTDSNWPYYPVGGMWDNIAITPASFFIPPQTSCPAYSSFTPLYGDINVDYRVNIDDLLDFADEWMDPIWPCTLADITRDKNVTLADFSSFSLNFAKEAPYNQTLTGKIMAGYQGWFNCPTDGAGRGWVHWGKDNRFEPGYCNVDLWPDMSEYGADEKYQSGFYHSDGSPAYVFSSYNRNTIFRHFKWMRDYGIDGVFLQRFGIATYNTIDILHIDAVLQHVRDAASQHQRLFAVMYDLTGLAQGGTEQIKRDWRKLNNQFQITQQRGYLHHRGKPVVAIWGIGFKDRAYTLQECYSLVDYLKTDPTYGNCTVMLGVPSYWRTLGSDCVPDSYLHTIIERADIVSPWSVGRYDTLSEVDSYASNVWVQDKTWCNQRGLDYLPVVFPGFSWYNMNNGSKPLNEIPRQQGNFIWRQFYKSIQTGAANMLYVAMFDEVDEATAIFKCTNNPPVGTQFVTYEGLPSDHYLWLTGIAGKMLRGNFPVVVTQPKRW